MTSSQTPLSGACQLGPERVAKALFRDLPEYVLGCKRAVRPDAPAKNAPVAQLDRALDYESRGQEFESLRARHSFIAIAAQSFEPVVLCYLVLPRITENVNTKAVRRSTNPGKWSRCLDLEL